MPQKLSIVANECLRFVARHLDGSMTEVSRNRSERPLRGSVSCRAKTTFRGKVRRAMKVELFAPSIRTGRAKERLSMDMRPIPGSTRRPNLQWSTSPMLCCSAPISHYPRRSLPST
jgi:hypothetical protein